MAIDHSDGKLPAGKWIDRCSDMCIILYYWMPGPFKSLPRYGR